MNSVGEPPVRTEEDLRAALVALEGRAPYRTVMAHERVLGGDGREMHKSWGNAVWFDDAVDQMGPDVIRLMFASQSVAEPMRFGVEAAREVKRRWLTLWNVYGLFVTYANLDRPHLDPPETTPASPPALEQWLLSRLQATIAEVRSALDAYQLRRAVAAVDLFVHDELSNWYVRRRRREFWKAALDDDKRAAYQTLYHVLVQVCQLLAPVMPFLAEDVYRNLVAGRWPDAPASVHLTRFPESDPTLARPALEGDVAVARRVLRVGLAARNAARLKVRQPLGRALLAAPDDVARGVRLFERDVLDELNVERLEIVPDLDDEIDVSIALDVSDPSALPPGAVSAIRADLAGREARALRGELLSAGRVEVSAGGQAIALGWADLDVRVRGRDGFAAAAEREVVVALDTAVTPALHRKAIARHLVHQVQMLRKEAGLHVADRIRLAVHGDGEVARALDEHRDYVCAETLADELRRAAPSEGWLARGADLGDTRVTIGLIRA